jgi:hypothetical protein
MPLARQLTFMIIRLVTFVLLTVENRKGNSPLLQAINFGSLIHGTWVTGYAPRHVLPEAKSRALFYR